MGDVVDVIEADAVLVVDGAGTIVHASAGAARVTGQTQAELRGLAVATVLAQGTRRIPRVAPRIVVVTRDDVRSSDELERMRAQLLLAERRATLGMLAGGVGHELRNIAQIQVACLAELEIALASGADGTELAALVRELLPDLRRVSEHVVTHGSRLLSLARPTPDIATAVELTDVVGDVVAMLRAAGKLRAIQLELAVAESITVVVNRTRIEQVLVNLLINATDAIGASDAPGAPGEVAGKIAIRVAATADRTRVRCSVRDTGCGIAADVIDRIWEPFFTTKPADRGTGLGLSIARELVEAYGGSLTVESPAGDGTTFTFELPCLRAALSGA